MSCAEQGLLRLYTQQRDAEAFRALVERHAGMVFATCHRILGNRADAEDATQNCFLQLTVHAGELQSPIAAWMHTIAVRVSLDMLRSRKARHQREIKAVRDSARVGPASWDEVKEAIDSALATLPDELRTPILLHYMEGRSQEEIARELGVSQPTISRRLTSGVEELRGRLRKAGCIVALALLGAFLAERAAEAAPATLTAALGKMALAGSAASTAAAGLDSAASDSPEHQPSRASTKLVLAATLVTLVAVAAALTMRSAAFDRTTPVPTSSQATARPSPDVTRARPPRSQSPTPAHEKRAEELSPPGNAPMAENVPAQGREEDATPTRGSVREVPSGSWVTATHVGSLVQAQPVQEPPKRQGVTATYAGDLVAGKASDDRPVLVLASNDPRVVANVAGELFQASRADIRPAVDKTASGPVARGPKLAAPPERIVRFPKDRSLGTLNVIDPERLEQGKRSLLCGPYSAPWKELGDARGDVVVPGGNLLGLMVGPAAARDLSGLNALKPDDLYMVTLCPKDASIDACMPHIASLTGLRALSLRPGRSWARLSGESVRHLKRLAELEYLESCLSMSDADLALICEMRSLRGLYQIGTGLTNAGLAHLARLPALEELWLSHHDTSSFGDAGLPYLTKCPRLRALQLSGNGFTNRGLACLNDFPALRNLGLSRFPINDAGLASLSVLESLESLDLSYTPVGLSGLAHIKKLRSLKVLRLCKRDEHWKEITDAWLLQIKDMKSLEELDLLNADLTDEGLAYLAQMPSLRMVSGLAGPITDDGLRRLSALTYLEELSFGDAGALITDDGIKALATLPHLRSLYLSKSRMTNEGIRALSKTTSLEYLDLGFGSQITVKGLTPLNDLKNLTTLRLLLSKDADDGPLDLSGLTSLEHLSLFCCDTKRPVFKDEDLACLAGLKELRWLSLAPHQFSQAALGRLPQRAHLRP